MFATKSDNTMFQRTLQVMGNTDLIEAVGAYGVCLRVSNDEAYSNMKEFADDGTLVPQFTDMLSVVVDHAALLKPGIRNPTLLAGIFLVRLSAELGERNFEAACRSNATADEGICHSHDFCDANMTMLGAAEAIGLDLDVQSDEDTELWNDAWDHAKRRMVASIK